MTLSSCSCPQQVLVTQYPSNRIITADTLARPWYDRFRITYLVLVICRIKYYFIWKVAEGSSIFTGFGFKGFDDNGDADWSGISNVDIYGFETASVSIKNVHVGGDCC